MNLNILTGWSVRNRIYLEGHLIIIENLIVWLICLVDIQ